MMMLRAPHALGALVITLLVQVTASAAPPRRCTIEPAIATPAAAVGAAPCRRPPAAIAKAVRAAIARGYAPVHEGGKPEVTFPCDGLGPRIREIVIETGAGHGGSLALWRAHRRPDGAYDVRGVGHQRRLRRSTASTTSTPSLTLATGVVKLPAMARARAALSARVREIEPALPPGRTGSMRGSSSSHDFHLVVRLVDDDGRVLERRYTGYESSDGQDAYLGLQLAAAALAPVTALALRPAAATPDDRELFADRFNAAVPHFDDAFAWWVMERQVELARELGTPAVIAGLLTRLRVTGRDRSSNDARAGAVDALAWITGWDAREGGATVDAAAARYLAECAVVR